MGKRRAVALGMVLSALSAVGLPLIGQISLAGALVGLFLFYISFEFTLVSSIPLMTELVPGARAVMMAGNISAISAGRMLGALAGPLLFRQGMLANGIACAAANFLALAILLTLVDVE
jgi:predicted MFS family arabinose efflux permease